MSEQSRRYDVAVIGAGVAGLAAAVALGNAGAEVLLLERRPFVGGRAYSYSHPALGEIIDSQHVVLGCCTNFVDLIAQAGAGENIRWYDELCFLEPSDSGTPRESWIRPGGLPAPGHSGISFLRAPMLTIRDKAGIASGLLKFLRGYPLSDEESFAEWLRRTGQTDRAIRHFWEPIVAGALNDVFERCSTKYAGKVFHESFLRSPHAGRLGIPAAPLSEFFQPVLELARTLGVSLRQNCAVESLARTSCGAWTLMTRDGAPQANTVIFAGSFAQAQELLSPFDLGLQFDKFVAAPITTVHLWFDREVTELDHAALLDTRIQWMFAKSRIRGWSAERGSYLELVISASWPELENSRDQIVASALAEAERFFPRIRDAKLLKSSVLKEARATFSVTPGLDRLRPEQRTSLPGLYLAGDWTATDWPSTMEGAIRSGRLAAGEIVGERNRFLAGEAPATGLMRLVSTI
jgi:squalene-associated FAD-dependent desaturase